MYLEPDEQNDHVRRRFQVWDSRHKRVSLGWVQGCLNGGCWRYTAHGLNEYELLGELTGQATPYRAALALIVVPVRVGFSDGLRLVRKVI